MASFGMFLSVALLLVAAIPANLGISYFLREKHSNLRVSLLFLGISAAVWSFGYGMVGITETIEQAQIFRMIGLAGVDGFVVGEVVMYLFRARILPKTKYAVLIAYTDLALLDWVYFSSPEVDEFYKLGDWMTWRALYSPYRTYHYIFIVISALCMLVFSTFWFRKLHFQRDRQFVKNLYFSNFALIFTTLPDTFLNLTLGVSFPTSAFGGALTLYFIWLAATRSSAFDLSVQNLNRFLMNAVNIGIFVFDMEGKLCIYNKYVQDHFDTGELLHKSPGEIFRLQDENSLLLRAMKEEAFSINARTIDNKSGYNLNISPALDRNKEPYAIIVAATDLTHEEEMLRKAEAASTAKSAFLSSMSHEIRTPINAILGMNRVILQEATEGQILEYSENIRIASEALLTQINDILDFSRIESGKMEIVEDSYHTVGLIDECRQMFQPMAQKKGLDFRLEYDRNLPRMLRGDKMRIRQIISNILSNAVKYTSSGSITFVIGRQTKDDENENNSLLHLVVRISDTGMGIRKEDIPHLFDKFSRFDQKQNQAISGAGLGMSIVKQLTELMGGDVSVDSTYGLGSTFTIVIPQKVEDPNPIGDSLQNMIQKIRDEQIRLGREGKKLILSGRKILLADDLPMNRKVVEAYLRHTEVTLDEAENGEEAVALSKKNHYDLILLDHLMPVLDGVDAMRLIQTEEDSKNQDTPIIVLTANAMKGDEARYLELGFAAYLPKPLEMEALEDKIRLFIKTEEGREQEEEEDQAETETYDSEFLNSLTLLDVKKGMNYCMEDEELFREILTSYVEDQKKDRLEEAYAVENLEEYRVFIHAVKSSSRTIGADQLGEEALKLEEAAKREDIGFIRANHHKVMRDYAEILSQVREALEGRESL